MSSDNCEILFIEIDCTMNNHINLVQTYHIDSHPITSLPEHLRRRYVLGLGAVLFQVSHGNEFMRTIFMCWCESIIGTSLPKSFDDDTDSIMKALALCRTGLNFFRMKHEFFFDCFYLTNKYNPQDIESLFLLLKNHTNIFTVTSLTQTYNYFKIGTKYPELPNTLLQHYETNKKWINSDFKRVLVVATMSAGKSTLINAITGYNFNRSKVTACTKNLIAIYNKSSEDGISGYTYDYKFEHKNVDSGINSDNYCNVGYYWNSLLSDTPMCIVDTPGVNNAKEPEHSKITYEAIASNDYKLLIYVANCKYLETQDEIRFLKYIMQKCTSKIIFVINQLDNIDSDNESIGNIIEDYYKMLIDLGFTKPIVAPMSSIAALLIKKKNKTAMEKVKLQSIIELFQDSFYDLPSYISKKESKGSLQKSGIELLETNIKSLL